MSQKNNTQNPHLPTNISESTLIQLMELEKQRLQIFMLKQQTRDKEIAANSKLAEKSIDAQAAHLKVKPAEDRKTLALIVGSVVLVILVFITFLCYLLHTGNKDFAKFILAGISHLIVAVGGYFAGKKSKKSNTQNPSDTQDADILENP